MCHETCAQSDKKCDMKHVHRVIRNMTWGMFTGLLEIGHETSVQGYQKCGRHVHRFIIIVTWNVYTFSVMWNEASVQDYLKCNMRHVHSVTKNVTDVCMDIRNVTWDLRTRLSEIGGHVHRVIINMTWGLCTWLSEMWHEECSQGY